MKNGKGPAATNLFISSKGHCLLCLPSKIDGCTGSRQAASPERDFRRGQLSRGKPRPEPGGVFGQNGRLSQGAIRDRLLARTSQCRGFRGQEWLRGFTPRNEGTDRYLHHHHQKYQAKRPMTPIIHFPFSIFHFVP